MEILDLANTDIYTAAEKTAAVLKRGGIVVYPTDTLYGMAVLATDRNALTRLKELKGREKKKPVSVVVPDIDTLKKYGVLNEKAERLARKFLPGPLTLVITGTPLLPSELMLNDQIGFRIPNDPFCLELARILGVPYTATSANRSGQTTPTTARAVIEQFGSLAHNIDLIIDGGVRDGGLPSTVVRCGAEIHILREGAVAKEELL